jgi:hypothetical protein
MSFNLYSILFEEQNSITEEQVVSEIENGFRKKNYSREMNIFVDSLKIAASKINWSIGPAELAKEIVAQGKTLFHKILKDSKEFKYMGGGAIGLAFDLGDMVLKLEVNKVSRVSSKVRTNYVNKTLSAGKVGTHVPMNYDQGSFTVYGVPVFWNITEKMETRIPGRNKFGSGILEWGMLIQDLINKIESIYYKLNPEDKPAPKSVAPKTTEKRVDEIMKELTPEVLKAFESSGGDSFSAMQESLWLAPDWMRQLVKDLMLMHDESQRSRPTPTASPTYSPDTHTGNIGLRRNGPVAYFKFFDA